VTKCNFVYQNLRRMYLFRFFYLMKNVLRIYQTTRITLRNTPVLPVGFVVLEILQYLGHTSKLFL